MKKLSVIILAAILLSLLSACESSNYIEPKRARTVIYYFNEAGLNVTNVHDGFQGSSSPLPKTYEEHLIFTIPEVAPEGGQVFVCDTKENCDKLYDYLSTMDELSGTYLYQSPYGTVVVQLNSGLSPSTAAKFENVINSLSLEGEPIIPSSTPTISNTPIPSDTPLSTRTSTPSPRPTITQIPTSTIELTEGPTPIPTNTATPRPTRTFASIREPEVTCPSGAVDLLGERSTSIRCYSLNTDWNAYGMIFYYRTNVVGIGVTYKSGAPYYVVDAGAEFAIEAASIYGWDLADMGSALADVTYMPENQWEIYGTISVIYQVSNSGQFLLLFYQAP